MSIAGNTSIEIRIRHVYAQLSLAERKLADVVLHHQSSLLNYSATELAEMAETSKSTAARFFKRLGCESFEDFRAQIKEEQTKVSPLSRMGTKANTAKQAKNPFTHHVSLDMQRLEAVSHQMHPDHVEKTIALLNKAKNIWIVGYRHSYISALYAHALLSHVRADVHLLHDMAGREAEMLSSVDKNDVVIVIDFKRRSQRLKRLVPAAHTLGADIVIISDTMASDLTRYASSVLCCSSDVEEGVFDSYVCAISLINYLASAVAAKNKAQTRKRLSRIEQMHAALEDLDTTV